MSITVKRANLWRVETPNAPGSLAATLKPLADKRANLEIVMGYAFPDKTRAAIEVFPIRTTGAQKAARTVGFAKASFPCVIISGENRSGLGHQIAAALAEAGININFFVAQTCGNHYTGLFSFEASTEADLAIKIIRSATAPKKARTGSRARRTTAGNGSSRRIPARA
jgi:hypothetical protein